MIDESMDFILTSDLPDSVKMKMILTQRGFDSVRRNAPIGTVLVKDDYMVFYLPSFQRWNLLDLTVPIGKLPVEFSCGEVREMITELFSRGIIT